MPVTNQRAFFSAAAPQAFCVIVNIKKNVALGLTIPASNYFGFAASAVSWRNSIFLAPLGGTKLNS